MTHQRNLPYVFGLLLRCPISSSLSHLGGAGVGGAAGAGARCGAVRAIVCLASCRVCLRLFLLTTKSSSKKKGKRPQHFGLCVSGNFQGKQRVFGAPFWKLASFPESESFFQVYPGVSRYTRKIPGVLPIGLILGPNQPQTRLRARKI